MIHDMPDVEKVMIDYTNWRGERGWRTISPKTIIFDSSKYHREKQWLLVAFDHDKNETRIFAMADVHAWGKELALGPVEQLFIAECIEIDPDAPGVTARDMYTAYLAWCRAKPCCFLTETAFGRSMKTVLSRDDKRVRRYLRCRLRGSSMVCEA